MTAQMKLRSPGQRLRFILLSAIVVPLLAGCINGSMDLKIDDKALGTGTLHMEINKQMASLIGMTSKQSALEMITGEDGFPKDAKTKVTENETSYIFDVTIKDMSLTDSSPIAKVLSDGRIEFTYVAEGETSSSDDSTSDFPGLTGSFFNYTVEMPGKIQSITGIGQSALKKINDRKFQIRDDTKTAINLKIISSVDKSLVGKIISSITRSTITCVKGKEIKKITASKPTCPKGYVKR